ncbi:Fungal trans [Geosmithia morbida]|uniref:Fungal trans n=1 Tax=Geosmithia morbida TaxID=1094350 RepID=A0A9P4Z016_9HYPO|nr:Fungal trans [Geosmithia morbida]KAF4126203.1 Fungal trans [Geosmithia morbida]
MSSKALPTPASSTTRSAHQDEPSPSLNAEPQQKQSSTRERSKRVLACHLCQKRKIKCDRRFPCANCTKKGVQCVPVAQPRQRRRRFPEHKLLERLREVEDLLLKNNVKYEPLHGHGHGNGPGHTDRADDDSGESGDESGHEQSNKIDHGASSTPGTLYHQELVFQAPEGSEPHVIGKKAWDQAFADDGHLLLSSPVNSSVQLWELHPEPVNMFRLWQIYLDNVNPIMRLAHPPTLQGRIIEAAGNVKAIESPLHCLLFGIYAMAVMSMTASECQATFGLPRDELLERYQFACQQALRAGSFLRTDDRDCLTGLFLYLISVREKSHPQALWSMLSVALRIAQRMGMHSEATNSRHNVLEAELRRRLWWAMAFIDSRMTEFTEYKATVLNPSWDCKVPLSVNDSELHASMTEPPAVRDHASDAMFVSSYSHIADYVRHSNFYLDFTNPMLKPLAKPRGDMDSLERMIETKYLQACDPNNAFHFMTMWTMRTFFSKYRLVEHYSRYSDPSMDQTEADREAAMRHAFNVLRNDTRLMESPLTSRYRWFLWTHFPMVSFVHVLLGLRRNPLCPLADEAWTVLANGYRARFATIVTMKPVVFLFFRKLVSQVWGVLKTALEDAGQTAVTEPDIVRQIKQHASVVKPEELASPGCTGAGAEQDKELHGDEPGMNDFLTSLSTDFNNEVFIFGQNDYGNTGGLAGGATQQQFTNWGLMEWGLGQPRTNW